jgi:hypothetical protein
MKLTEVRKQHGEILRAIQNAVSILQPITTSESKGRYEVYVKPENIDLLRARGKDISSPDCQVSIIDKEKPQFNGVTHALYSYNLVCFEGSEFRYEIAPEEIVNVRNRLTKVFKSIECYDKKYDAIQKRRIFTEQKQQTCQTPLPNTLKSANSKRTPKTRAKSRTKKLTSWQKALKTIKSILRLAR